MPGGAVTAAAFAELSAELLRRLGELPRHDGFWYGIHGAMTVEGVDDTEAVLLARIRETVGTDVIVSTSMDMHGNVSRELAHVSDLITCSRMAPHEDRMETKEPAIWVGYAWADEPHNRAAVVVTGPSEAAVAQGAERLARGFWEARGAFAFVAPTGSLAECLDEARASSCDARPFFVSDTGDNPTAGGASDVTWGLERVLAHPELYVIITRLRKPYHHEHDFTGLALDPRRADVVVVKIGHLEPELFALSAGWKMALPPGGVDQYLVGLGHHRVRRPMFPFDPHMPDLDARPASSPVERAAGRAGRVAHRAPTSRTDHRDERRPADTSGSSPGQIPLRRNPVAVHRVRQRFARTGDRAPTPPAVRHSTRPSA
nr:M81 family metallopeptidase [Streptomyces sp. RLB1-33]